MPYDKDDVIQDLQLRVNALEYMVRMLVSGQSSEVKENIDELTNIEIERWKNKSPEIIQIMEQALTLVKR
ncbi:hypothetical protein MUA02_04260 [Enterobacteriaceae bacterium H20N1]|uniref:Uncharacterized protein n=1 Tax=Dryocola boscaweniae TaxID=2925397 RepID=A0A9X2W6S6_9ENTR|nr:hypothetical protein [Dryocola boscaweniae]MCT4701232.1 hypothetical protein [Dryocola boscaweniae]MCT4718263.1 hypothetical protein [Dryocola boscaweniae]